MSGEIAGEVVPRCWGSKSSEKPQTAAMTPLGRPGTTEEIAKAVVFSPKRQLGER